MRARGSPTVWVTTLIDMLLHAVEERRERALNPTVPIPDWRRFQPVEPGAILSGLQGQTERDLFGLVTVPLYVTEAVVKWALGAVTLAHGAGRGSKAKLTPASLRSLLLDPDKLARAVGTSSGRLKR